MSPGPVPLQFVALYMVSNPPVEVSNVCLLPEIIPRPSTPATYTPEQLVSEVSDKCCSLAKCVSSYDQAFEMSCIVSPVFL